MRLICDCGNEMDFNTIDEETGEQTNITENEGQYATTDYSKFRFWESHDVIGIICAKCDKAIWIFV